MSNDLQKRDQGFKGMFRTLFMSPTDYANEMNRSITNYDPNTIDPFFDPSRGVFNTIVSGGDTRVRNSAIVAQTTNAIHNNFPVIILHEGNSRLERDLRTNFQRTGHYQEISTSSPAFEPFYKLSALEITNLIMETAPKDYELKQEARYYIDGIAQVIKKSGKNLSFKMFVTCPHALMFDRVTTLQQQGTISDAEAQDITSRLMTGQLEKLKIESFLSNLKMEIEPFLYQSHCGYKPVNIFSSIKDGQILCFDIASVTNSFLINTLVFQLKLALTRGLPYVLIVDSISTSGNENLSKFLMNQSDKISTMLCADDFYSMVGSDEKIFSALVGNSPNLVIMSHSSNQSAIKWSEVFGQYDKLEQSFSKTKGGSKRTPFSLLSSPNYSNQVTTSKAREFIIKPEQITRLGQTEAYILSAARGEVAHLHIVV